MRVNLSRPSAMDCKVVNTQDAGTLGYFQLRRYSKKQRLVNVSLIEVRNENGETVDSGFLAVDTRTGRLVIERCTQDVPFDIELKKDLKNA